MRAAQTGKHIFCEKPIDTKLAKIEEALAAVKKAGVKPVSYTHLRRPGICSPPTATQ